jgi:Fe-S-cluster containining protein
MERDAEIPEDCRRCGACCFSESPRHARVTGDDHARLGADADRLVVFLEDARAYMRLADLGGERACAALVVAAGGGFACSVYDRRPDVCRALDRGSPACAGEIAQKDARARRALLSLRP